MKISSNIIKETILVLFLFFLLISCKNQKTVDYLPVNKISIIEYRFMIEDGWKFQVVGFCEMDKNFNLRYILYGYDGYYYRNEDIAVADSLKNKISTIILNYPSDTTFLYAKDSRIYDGNYYRFIIEKNDSEKIEIKFIPELLPMDLFSLYKCLYEDRQDSLKKDFNRDLFNDFENQIKSELNNNLP
jgi:hypothetical protein